MEDSHTEHSAPTDSKRMNSSVPPCCGSGCAVCVLDYWVDDVPGEIPPELLEAFEEAERLAERMIDRKNDSETDELE